MLINYSENNLQLETIKDKLIFYCFISLYLYKNIYHGKQYNIRKHYI